MEQESKMAFIEMNFMSEALMRTVPVNVILPADKLVPPGAPKPECRPFQTLYLLNGVMGNHTDWMNATAIQALAEERDLAVIMPGGENMFYLDHEPTHALYGEFVGKELVEFTRKIFPLSQKREDTFIGGLSMGGYGALRNGLKYSDHFGKIVSLSAAMMLYTLEERTDDHPMFMERRSFAMEIFGDFDKVMESDRNPVWLLRQLKEQGREIPEIYQAVGTEDFLLSANRQLHQELVEAGADVTYAEMPGGHDWSFWRSQLPKLLDWLPLDDVSPGINSGNIGVNES